MDKTTPKWLKDKYLKRLQTFRSEFEEDLKPIMYLARKGELCPEDIANTLWMTYFVNDLKVLAERLETC